MHKYSNDKNDKYVTEYYLLFLKLLLFVHISVVNCIVYYIKDRKCTFPLALNFKLLCRWTSGIVVTFKF